MALSKTIIDEELGEIKLAKYKKSKYLKVKIDHKGSVSLSMPFFVPYNDAIEYLQEKRSWVKEQIAKIEFEKKQLKIVQPETVIDIPETKDLDQITSAIDANYKTKFHDLELIPCEVGKANFRISTNKIKIYYPKELSSKDESVKEVIDEALRKTLRREAKMFLPRRLKELAEQNGLFYKSLTLRDTKTRWGSCTHDNKINICIHVMKLPDELIDYVLLHELAHTVEKNHSKDFWDLCTKLLKQDAKKLDSKLKNYSTDIILL
jgi:predicted metal-dependent hydrolase